MEFIVSRVVPLIVTALMLLAGMALALFVGNVSGKIIRKFLGIGGK